MACFKGVVELVYFTTLYAALHGLTTPATIESQIYTPSRQRAASWRWSVEGARRHPFCVLASRYMSEYHLAVWGTLTGDMILGSALELPSPTTVVVVRSRNYGFPTFHPYITSLPHTHLDNRNRAGSRPSSLCTHKRPAVVITPLLHLVESADYRARPFPLL